MGVSTGTICPFPFTTANISETPTNVSQCTVTYAQSIGALYEAFRILLLTATAVGILLMGHKTYLFYLYSLRSKINLAKHPMFRMIVLALAFNIVVLIGTVDMFAFNGIYPAEFYVILDEVAASLGLSNAVLFVDLYHQLTKYNNEAHRFSRLARNGTLIAIWVNFIGFIVLGVLDSANYHLYEGLKCAFGSLIFVGFIVTSTYYVKRLLAVLRMGMELQADKSITEAQIQTLKRKHCRFVTYVGFGSTALAAAGILAFASEDYSWTLKIETMPEPAQLALRVVYAAYVILQMFLFRVPQLEPSSGSSGKTTMNEKKVKFASENANSATRPQSTTTSANANQIVPVGDHSMVASSSANEHEESFSYNNPTV